MKFWNVMLAAALVAGSAGSGVAAEVCTPQSKMTPTEREALDAAAVSIAQKIAASDESGLKALTVSEYRQDFAGMAGVMNATAPNLKGAQARTEQVYLLDASSLQKGTGGANPDANFYCTLNQSASEAEFSIPQLPPGRYAFAMVRMEKAAPWRLSMLLRQEEGKWELAGLYPKAMTAGGHEGIWYWKQARTLASEKQQWNAWLYMQEAQQLLLPANFVSSTNLDKLQSELAADAPPVVSSGLSSEQPLVLKGADGSEFRFTNITVDDSLGTEKIDVAAHIKVDALGDQASARKRNVDAMAALVSAHPELKQAFHGVWVISEAGPKTYATELAMGEIH